MLHNIYFSGRGTTKFCARWIEENLHMDTKVYDWFAQPPSQVLEIPEEDVLLFVMPVYGGFIPQICAEMAKKLKGNKTLAIIAAVYGNRHYDYALRQMKDILAGQGFVVIGAGAFVAEHSVFPAVAAGRPDERDKAAMKEFAVICASLLKVKNIGSFREIRVPGALEYDPLSYKGASFKPTGDERCIGCGRCARICPKRAISMESLCSTDEKLCIACGACMRYCPTKARGYHDGRYETVRENFEKRCSSYRLPETYYAEPEML